MVCKMFLRMWGSFFRTQETGLPVSVSVRVGGKTFNLHKVRK